MDPSLVAATLPETLGLVLAAYGLHRRSLTSPGERLRLSFTFPMPERTNMTVIFDGRDAEGPFAARAVLVKGEDLALTRDSVDGLPDGEDRTELVAPMTASPFGGDNLHRLVGMIGIQASRPSARGRIRVEIFDRHGRILAARAREV